MTEGVKLMDKELVELFETAKKAADAAASEDGDPIDEAQCLDALKELKEFPVNYQVLVSTQVGKRLKHLTKHPRKKIQCCAANLIEIWKNVIMDETARKKNANSYSDSSVKIEPVKAESSKKAVAIKVEKVSRGEYVAAKNIEPDISPRPQKLAKLEAHGNGNSLKIESSSSEVLVKVENIGSTIKRPASDGPLKLTSMVKSNDPMRDKVRELLLDALSKVYSEVDENVRGEVEKYDPIRVAVSVESVMFENWGRSNGPHKYKYRSLMFNMKDQSNPDFRRKVLTGKFEPEKICNLSPTEMASSQRQIEIEQIEKKKLFDCERGQAPKATTDQFKCSRCNQRKCTYYQMQTRSADEPMTTYVTCVNCNNHWKFC